MPPVVISDLRGGRNGIDSVIDPRVPTHQCREAINVDFSEGPLGRRRGGASALAITGGTAFTTAINSLSRFVPSGDETLAEMFGVDSAPIVKRLAGGTSWANVSLDDAISTRPQDFRTVTFNGKHFCAYTAGATDRLHVYDPGLAAPRIRRVGIAPGSTAPTVANNGVGIYSAVARFYRIRFIQVTGSAVTRRSEPTPASASFTPSGASLSARVTRPTAPGEGETHWEIDASADNVAWNELVSFALSTHIAIATTFYDDTTTVSGYITLTVSDEIGFYTLPPSAEFVVTDNNRLIMAGRLANSNNTSRVWFTPVLGSSDQGDDERLVDNARLKTLVDLNEKDGGKITGLSDPVSGLVFAFKYRRTWRLVPTGDSDVPYQPREMSHIIGAIEHDAIVVAEDDQGRPAVYFLSHKGPYRIGANGLQFLGRDIEDQWRGLSGKSAVNLGATTKVAHGRYYESLSQIWWWVATGSSNTPNVKLVLDIKQATIVDRFGIRGGWSIHDGDSAAAICSTLFSNTVGAAMSRDLKPYVGRTGPEILKCDTTDNNDDGTAFQAYIKTRSIIPPDGLSKQYTVGESILVAKAQASTVIRQTIFTDFEKRSHPADVSIAAEAAETEVIRKYGDSMASDVGVAQIQLGDPAAVSVASWSLHALIVNVFREGDV